ncbi:MAG: GYD domain-containing protein [Proteobacteria bacterium]|nr:GYD domain-containing protein [Pseudomonadota bacterium]
MATYIMLHRHTQKGIENIKRSPVRLHAARKALKALGAELKQFYVVAGQYDIVTIIEAPDDETIAKFALDVASKGNVTTETLPAFTEDEYREIIAGIVEGLRRALREKDLDLEISEEELLEGEGPLRIILRKTLKAGSSAEAGRAQIDGMREKFKGAIDGREWG